jgi:Interferon-induced transmembrane protein
MNELFPGKRRRFGARQWIRVLVFVAVSAVGIVNAGSHRVDYLAVVAFGALLLTVRIVRGSRSRRVANMSYGSSTGYATPGAGQTGYGLPGSVPAGPPPPTYLAWRIIASICGLLFNVILGLPAARVGGMYSNQAAELWASGDEQAAASASRKARGWLTAATVLDAIGLILVIVLLPQVLATPPNFNNPSAVAASIKSQLQQKLNDQTYEPGVTVTSAVCTPSGTSTDYCVVTLSSGQIFATTAAILDNGEGFRTQGFHIQ